MNIWHIAMKDIRIFLRDIPGLIYLILTPIIVIAIASFALSGIFADDEVERFSIPLVVEDEGELTNQLVDVLQETSVLKIIKTTKDGKQITRQEAEKLVPEYKAAIVIPDGFSDNVAQGELAELIVMSDPAERVIPGVVHDILSQYTAKLSMQSVTNEVAIEALMHITELSKAVHGVELDPTKEIQSVQEKSEYYVENPPIQVVTNVVQGNDEARETTPFESNVPGYAVMFVLLGTTAAASSLLDERERGTLGKLQTLPITRMSILSGKMLANFMTALFQMFVLFTVGHFVFQMWLGPSILGLVLLIVATAFAATGMAMLIASVCKTRAQASGISLLIVLSMSALGGSWWPLYIVPDWLQTVAHVTLTAWAMSGFNNLLVYGQGFTSILTSITVLFSMGILFLILSVRFFRFN